jgi:heat shock protein HslJ
MRQFLFLLLAVPSLIPCAAQRLQPGFNVEEYRELLKVFNSYFGRPGEVGYSSRFPLVHRPASPVGLDNLWELHMDSAGVAVLSIRGTTRNAVSWLENAYAAMTPATGTLQLEKALRFDHALAADPRAAVHVGWLVGMAYLHGEIMPRLDSLMAVGVRDVFVFGHSQGGAIAYLLTAHLLHLRDTGALPAELRIKTYCSAAPKPGNLPFAQDFEYRTRGGWAFNVVNALDWVPEVPVSIQTTDDFNEVNPFGDPRRLIGNRPLAQRIALRRIYNRLDRPARRAQRNYEKYLGRGVGRAVRKQLPEYEPGTFASTTHYVRTGTPIVLMPDSAYHARFPQDPEKLFIHHMLEPYYFLASRYSPVAEMGQPGVQGEAEKASLVRQRLIMKGVSFHATGQGGQWRLEMHPEQGLLFNGPGSAAAQVIGSPLWQRNDSLLLGGYPAESGIRDVLLVQQPSTIVTGGTGSSTQVRIRMNDGTTFAGCGEHLPPVRLHDIWMLHRINGQVIDPRELAQVPRLEFHAAEQRFFGETGCNNLSGTFTAVHQGLRFAPPLVTRKHCEGKIGALEQQLLAALRSGDLTISFSGNELTLTGTGSTELVFRRTD